MRAEQRRMAKIVGLVLAVVVLGCVILGVSANRLLQPSNARSGTRAGSPPPTLTRAQAVGFARAVNLRAPDVRGFLAFEPAKTLHVAPDAAACERTVGGSVATSPRLENRKFGGVGHPYYEVSSAVILTGGPALASRQLAIDESATALACLKAGLEGPSKGIGSEGSTNIRSQVRVFVLPSPLPGVPAFARESQTCTELLFGPCTPKHPVSIDRYLGFTVGPALVTLHDSGFPRPFPPALERRLLSLLYRRATALAH